MAVLRSPEFEAAGGGGTRATLIFVKASAVAGGNNGVHYAQYAQNGLRN